MFDRLTPLRKDDVVALSAFSIISCPKKVSRIIVYKPLVLEDDSLLCRGSLATCGLGELSMPGLSLVNVEDITRLVCPNGVEWQSCR